MVKGEVIKTKKSSDYGKEVYAIINEKKEIISKFRTWGTAVKESSRLEKEFRESYKIIDLRWKNLDVQNAKKKYLKQDT